MTQHHHHVLCVEHNQSLTVHLEAEFAFLSSPLPLSCRQSLGDVWAPSSRSKARQVPWVGGMSSGIPLMPAGQK
jgi:hypothetical protein